MGTFDVIVRGVAIAILLFVASFLLFTLLSFFISGIWPLRHALLVAFLSSVAAAAPMVLIHLTRSASGAAAAGAVHGRAFLIYAVLTGVFALLFTSLIVGGQLSL